MPFAIDTIGRQSQGVLADIRTEDSQGRVDENRTYAQMGVHFTSSDTASMTLILREKRDHTDAEVQQAMSELWRFVDAQFGRRVQRVFVYALCELGQEQMDPSACSYRISRSAESGDGRSRRLHLRTVEADGRDATLIAVEYFDFGRGPFVTVMAEDARACTET